MEQLDTTNIDNLYRAGLAHYAEALFAARHFEYLIHQSIKAAFDDKRKNGLSSALNDSMDNETSYRFSSITEKNLTTAREEWGMWITHKYEIKTTRLKLNLNIGYLYWRERSSAMLALTNITRPFRKQMENALNDYNVAFFEHDGGIYIYVKSYRVRAELSKILLLLYRGYWKNSFNS